LNWEKEGFAVSNEFDEFSQEVISSKKVEIIENLPKSTAGKVLKRVLREKNSILNPN
jgi:acyl-coenzyme A synthetase/AMP-(fatty) acid ligase